MSRRTARATLWVSVVISGCSVTPDPSRAGEPAPTPNPAEVPVPYGTEEQSDITGAVTSVSVDDNDHLRDVLEMLRGRVAGLQITELPNGDIRLRIRGTSQSLQADDASNQPLLVIDDMPVQPRRIRLALKGLNPRDIESITVLKDVGSTAIYGSRGANGVILIVLKR